MAGHWEDERTAISLPLSTATLSSTQAIALIQQRYGIQIEQYRISIWEKYTLFFSQEGIMSRSCYSGRQASARDTMKIDRF